MRQLKIIRFLRLIRILKQVKMGMGRGAYISRVLKTCTYFFFLAHWVCCSHLIPSFASVVLVMHVRWQTPWLTAACLGSRRTCSYTHVHVIVQQVGCLWWRIGAEETKTAHDQLLAEGKPASMYDNSWLQRIPAMAWNGRGKAYPLELDSPFWQQYLSSLYWALTALVKVPWIVPFTVGERAFASLIVMVGAIFFAFLLGTVVAALQVRPHTAGAPEPV